MHGMSHARLQAEPLPERAVVRPEDQWALRPSDRGRAVHELIGELLLQTRTPSDAQIRSAVAAHDLVHREAVMHGRHVKHHLVSSISTFFRRFAPCELWDFVGYAVRMHGCEFDLLWQDSRSGRIMADELKTGLFGLKFQSGRLDAQLARQLRTGAAACGPQFAGMRAIVLGEPWRSFLVRPDGTRDSLNWEIV